MTSRASRSTSRPTVEIRPQPGPQEIFLSTPADIAIYGGAAGGGKSWGLLLDPIRHSDNPGFAAVFFRRTTVQVRNPGGLWDESVKLYGMLGAKPRKDVLEWTFRGGAKVKFGHLEHDTTVLDWQGAQIPALCFDELTHFSEEQFFYMLSRNRSMCGVRPYVRATCNPDADSWVATFISWWIDQRTGLPIPSRAGKLRWFVRVSDEMIWADSRERLKELYPTSEPKSVTFIPAKLSDNKKLMEADPGYLANLQALGKAERGRLLDGNWKVRQEGKIFKRDHFQLWPAKRALPRFAYVVQSYDTAFTEKTANDATACSVWGVFEMPDGRYGALLVDCWRDHIEVPDLLPRVLKEYEAEYGASAVEAEFGAPLIGPTRRKQSHGRRPDILVIEAKGSGIGLCQSLARQKIPVKAYNPGKLDKVARAHLVTPHLDAGLIWVPESRVPERKGLPTDWADELVNECIGFGPGSTRDDMVDTLTQAIRLLVDQRFLVLEDDADATPEEPDDERPSTNPYAA
ncbi:MAG: terminase large subunit domain-containing protein [Alphaproteobacteria bacterium]